MANKEYEVSVTGVATRDDGINFVLLKSVNNAWSGDRWWILPAPAGGNNAFLATALTIISANLPAVAWMDERLKEYDKLVQLRVSKRAGS